MIAIVRFSLMEPRVLPNHAHKPTAGRIGAVVLAFLFLSLSCRLGRADEPRHGDSRTKAGAPAVDAQSAAPFGTRAMTAGGRVHPHGLATTYYFEYGPTAAYGARTAPAALGPRLAAYYREDWDEGLGGWFGGLSGSELLHHGKDGVSGGFVRFSEPSGDDPNHVDGIGTLHLAKYAYPGPLSGVSLQLGGGDPDLRGARVSLHVRGNQWLANGSELIWWTQSQSNIDLLHESGWRRANWAYTGTFLTDLLNSGKWEKAEYRLLNDPGKWSYAGNNRKQGSHDRYAYWPLDDSQRHANCDFFHLLAFVDPRNRPKGSIDFDEFLLVYRNHSLLLPSNGGRLVAAGAGDHPAALTDGWRHGPGRTWQSAAEPAGPQEFVYAFQDPVTIRSVQLHQNPDWPAREVEVSASVDGKTYSPLVSKTVPERGDPNANFAFVLDQRLSTKANFLRVRILSGYRSAHWGLGEIEVFGEGATMLPDDDWYEVNADIAGFKPGEVCHWRLVASNAAGTTCGEDQSFAVPSDARPHVVTGGARRVAQNGATVEGRLNPMGQPTEFWVEYGPNTGYGARSASAYGGLQETPRTVLIPLTSLVPSTEYHYRLAAKNQTGVFFGADAVLRTSR